MTPAGSKKEKPIIDPKVVAASEYVMKNDSVIAEWGKTNPSHFIRLVEDLVEWHNSELTQALKELKKEVIGDMTPTEQDKELRERVATIVEYWDFSPLQDEDTRIERLKNEIMELITADRKRVALEARIDELEHCCGRCGVWHSETCNISQRRPSFRERVNELKQELVKL